MTGKGVPVIMTATTTKQRALTRLQSGLKKPLNLVEPESRPILEQIIFAILREGVSRPRAEAAYAKLFEAFFDVNEIRVSMPREVALAISELPNPYDRAERIITLLQEVFETSFSFDLEGMHKKGVKLAEKQLERFKSTNPFTVAYVVQNSLGGHALPIDADGHRVLTRLELIEPNAPLGSAAGAMEHLVPKVKGAEFCEAVSAIAHGYCFEQSPQCSGCPMNDLCPSAKSFLAAKSGANGKATGKVKVRN
jgi:endonuclease-3